MADAKKSEHPEWEELFRQATGGTEEPSGTETGSTEEGPAEQAEITREQKETPSEQTEEKVEPTEEPNEPADEPNGSEGTEVEAPKVEEPVKAEDEPTEQTEATEPTEKSEPAEKADTKDGEKAPEEEAEAEVDQKKAKGKDKKAESTEGEIKITAQVHEDDGEVHQAKQTKAEKRKFRLPENWLHTLASTGIGIAAGVLLCMAVIGTSNRGKVTDVETLPTVTAPAVTPSVNMANPELVVNLAQKSRALGPKGVDTMYGMLGDDIVIDWYNHTFKDTFGKRGWKIDHSATGAVTLKKSGCNAVVTLQYDLAAGENAEDRIDELVYQYYVVEVKEECLRDEVYYDGISWRGVHLGDSPETVKERMYDSEYIEMNPDKKNESWSTDGNSIFDHETLASGVEKCYYAYQGKRLAFTFIRDRLVRVYVEVPYQPLEGLGSGYGDSFGALRELSDMPLAPWDNSLENTFCAIGFGSAWEQAVAEGTTGKFENIGWWDLPDSREYPGTHVGVQGVRSGYVERFGNYKISRDNVAVTTVPDIHWRGLTWVNGESDFLRMYGDAILAETDSENGYRHLVFSPFEGTRLHVWFDKDQVVAVQTSKTTQYTEEEWASFPKSYTGLE